MSKLTNSRGSYKVNLLFHISYLFIVVMAQHINAFIYGTQQYYLSLM